MELGPRDRLSQAFVHEVEKGRTIDTPYGPIVHLDLRHLGEKLIDTKLPFVRELCLKYERIDPVTELIPVRPVVHYMMGGVHTDIDGATPLAGPVRRGRGRLREHQRRQPARLQLAARVLVFGARAGRAAAEYAAARRPHAGPSIAAQAADEVRRLERDLLGTRAGHASAIAAIRDEMQTTMEDGAGIYRDRDPLAKGADTLRELQERVGNVGIADTAGPSTPSWSPRSSWPTCSTSPRRSSPSRAAARGVARRAPAHRLPGPRRRAVPGPLAGRTATRDGDAAGRATCR